MTPERLCREVVTVRLKATQITRDLERYHPREAARARMLDKLLDGAGSS